MAATKQKYPQYKVTQWIDTSEEAMNKSEATIRYGVDIKPKPSAGVHGGWLHLAINGTPMIFDTAEEASAKIDALKI